jgi:hypothetical protein
MAMCVSLQAIFVRKKQVSLSRMDKWWLTCVSGKFQRTFLILSENMAFPG